MNRYRKTSALAASCAILAGAVWAGSAPADPRVTVLGAAKPAKASCPQNCLVEARVTGFQQRIGKRGAPFRVPAPGRIVAWSIKLGAPSNRDVRFFNRSFGKSQARLAVLKPMRIKKGRAKGKLVHRLVRQGPVMNLRPFFGNTLTFGLEPALPVKRNHVVALTIPTWAPAFAVGQPKKTKWLASRKPTRKRGRCATRDGRANLKAGGPQVKQGTSRKYGCAYREARLLYSATFVPD